MRSRDVERVYGEGISSHGDLLVLFLAPGSGDLAVVASRRIGGAVRRNRARRILRSAWREVTPGAGSGFDAVAVAKVAIVGASTNDLVTEMNELLSKAPAR